MGLFESLVGLYGTLALTHLFLQISLAHVEYLNARKLTYNPSFHPRVAIIIPTYNEDIPSLLKCVDSCARQEYGGSFTILVVNDGSKNRSGFEVTRERLRNLPHVQFLDVTQNKGKRHAQKHGFDRMVEQAEIVVTIDSDTILQPNTLSYLVQRFQDPTIGAVTGDVKVIKTKSLLSQLIAGRYWSAFNQERAAQSLFGTVLCCSGPLAAYRNSVIQVVKEKYISQQFLGEYCTYGDDRHLTNLVLEQGYKVHFDPRAKAWTHVPQGITEYLRQQTRWNKSFYRELFWTVRMIVRDPTRLHPYMVYDLIVQTFLPFLFIASLGLAIYQTLTFGVHHLAGYLSVMIGVALIRALYGFLRTWDWNLLKFPIYSFIYIFLLIPVRVYAILTLKTTHWGTRG